MYMLFAEILTNDYIYKSLVKEKKKKICNIYLLFDAVHRFFAETNAFSIFNLYNLYKFEN